MARKIKLEDPIQVKGILEQLFRDLNLDEKIQDYKIIQLWNEFLASAANPELATKLQKFTSAHRVTLDRALVVGVKSAVIANELQFIKPMLEKRFINLVAEYEYEAISKLVFEMRS